METLVCIDRDGTLIYDDKYYLGSQEDWKEKIQFLPKVVEGVKELNKLSNTGIYMITNQKGIAVKELDKLTMERAEEVCEEVLKRLEERGSPLDNYFVCPHASTDYAERKDWTFHDGLVCDCDCIKPRLGMVTSALEEEGINLDETSVYVIGDRVSDVKTAVNAGGTGILVPFENEPGQREKAEAMGNVYVKDNLLKAANHINSLEKD